MQVSRYRSALRSSSASASRAQLSPLFRRRTTPAAFPVRPAADHPPLNLERWWHPHLLDRLQMPLSRIHE